MIRVDEWAPAGGVRLEPNALVAVRELEKNVIVTAGPGAGKTELLAQRADYVFRTGASKYPLRILAISFKVDAARNLQSRVRERSGSLFAARFDSFTFHAFAKRLVDNYRPALTGASALHPDYRLHPTDRVPGEQIRFEDLVPLALEILDVNPFARGALRQTYSHIFMDEFQDATGTQYEFLRQAFEDTNAVLTGVGDTKQRIMVFAGALEGIMGTFASDFDARELNLYQNFRSKPRLRRMQNRMILDMEPSAASSDSDLAGDEGNIQVLRYATDRAEAKGVANLIKQWLGEGVSPSEITVLVRQTPHLVAVDLGHELSERGIPFRNEQSAQDLTAEPAVSLLFNYLRVIADEQRPSVYGELVRVVTRGGLEESDSVTDSKLRRLLTEDRSAIRSQDFDRANLDSWIPLVTKFLKFVSRPVLNSLSPSYQQGHRLEDVINQGLDAFRRELEVDADPVAALNRLSEEDAIRILTVHKCKGLEFEKVVILGVERQLFWGDEEEKKAEFFVSISRAKQELVLTTAARRSRPAGVTGRWDEERTPHEVLLAYAEERMTQAR